MTDLDDLLIRIEILQSTVDRLADRELVREHYSVGEFAAAVGRAEFTVREWCRHGRVRAAKKRSGRGRSSEWVVSHDELLRFRRDGLLPLRD